MIRRTVSLILLVWVLGFIWFAIALPQPLAGGKSDGIVVLTGGGGRIGRGLEALEKGWGRRMLVSGVDREVLPGEFQAEYKVPAALMACCVTLGFESVDTRSNAQEIARWLIATKARSVRLVTTDWHIRRTAFEVGRVKPDGVTVVEDAVPSRPSFWILFLEYHKILASRAASLWPWQ